MTIITMINEKKTLIMIFTLCMSIMYLYTSCEDDEKTDLINLSSTFTKVTIGDNFSVEISLDEPARFKTIKVVKTIDGKESSTYDRTLNVSELTFPYVFTEKCLAEDETGVVVYSFYGMDASGNNIDASDLVLEIDLAEIPLLLKYDWKLTGKLIGGYEFADDALKDDINRFNKDLSWQLDWGTNLSDMGLEKLNSYCSWQIRGSESEVDSIFMIRYNIFGGPPTISKYKVLKLRDQEMILQSTEDWSWLGLSAQEAVLDKYVTVAKSNDFTPYRGENSASYQMDACKPGSY